MEQELGCRAEAFRHKVTVVYKEANKEAAEGIELETYFEFNGIQISSDEMVQRTRAAI